MNDNDIEQYLSVDANIKTLQEHIKQDASFFLCLQLIQHDEDSDSFPVQQENYGSVKAACNLAITEDVP